MWIRVREIFLADLKNKIPKTMSQPRISEVVKVVANYTRLPGDASMANNLLSECRREIDDDIPSDFKVQI